MSAPIVIDCPHQNCRAIGANYTYIGEYESNRYACRRYGLYRCGACDQPVIAIVSHNHSGRFNLSQMLQPVTDQEVSFNVEIIPSKPRSRLPDYIEGEIANDFEDAQFNLDHGKWNSAGTAYRRTLDICTKTIWPEHKDKWLKLRIDAALKDGLITGQLHKLAMQLKDMGDEAVHDEVRFTEEQAQDIAFFTEQFLTYCITLPARIDAYTVSPESSDNS